MICAPCGLIGRTCIQIGSVTFLVNVTFLKHENWIRKRFKTFAKCQNLNPKSVSIYVFGQNQNSEKTWISIFANPLLRPNQPVQNAKGQETAKPKNDYHNRARASLFKTQVVQDTTR